jgi:hypothetical protein
MVLDGPGKTPLDIENMVQPIKKDSSDPFLVKKEKLMANIIEKIQ